MFEVCSTMRFLRFSSLILAGFVCPVIAFTTADSSLPPHRDGVVLMRFEDNISANQQNAILTGVGASIMKKLGAHALMLNVGNGRVQGVVQALKAHREILYAEPDYQTLPLQDVASTQSQALGSQSGSVQDAANSATDALPLAVASAQSQGALPNDTFIGFQWAVQNTGQTVNGWTGKAGADERALAAWGSTTGTNSVVVAVLDSGVQYSHPDLLTNMWNNPGGIGGCAAGTHGYNVLTQACDPMDDETAYGGHGTHVAGILGAVANNAAGVAGVNWTTSILAIKWVDSNDSGFTSNLITAMDWVIAAKQAGVNVRVVNDSQTWPGTAFSQALSDEIDKLTTNDILFVTAAGNTAQNNDTTPRYPCSYDRPGMICVAASDPDDNLWTSDSTSGSNYGTTSVQLAAPGVNIYSTKRLSNFGYITGTSMASPQVAGAAALILSRGYMSVSNLKSAILSNVDVLSSLTGFVGTGGRLNVCKAVPGCSSLSTGTPANSALPVITGVTQQGSVLGASTGLWSGGPTSYTYQWYRCNNTGSNCSKIPGARSQSYAVLASADVGNTLAVVVTASNSSGSASAQSSASAPIASASTPFAINSSVTDGQTISGSVLWEANPAHAINFAQFFIDGVLAQTVSSSPYEYNQSTTGLLDTTTLSNGAHVLGIRALSSDNRTYAFYGATVTVTNGGGGGGGGITLVQSSAVQGSAVGSVSAAFTSVNTAGNLIVAFVRISTATQTVTVTDTAGNSYVKAVSQAQTTDGHQVYIFYAKNIGGKTNTVTATFSSTNNHPWLAIYEYSGLSTTSPLDRTAAAQGSSTSPTCGATAATTAANELVFAGLGLVSNSTATVSPGTGYTLQQQDTNTSRAANETAVVSSTGTQSASFTLSSATNYSCVVATFASTAVSQPPTITTSSLPNGTQKASYNATLVASGGVTPYTWTVVSGTLPAGLSLAQTTGVISGAPTATGTSNFTVQVKDSNSQTATKALSISINAAIGGITLPQSNAVQGSAVGSVSLGFPNANTSGNLIVVFVRMSTTTQTVTVTDTAGNTYTQAVSQVQSSDGHQVYIFYAKNIAGKTNTVTATFSSTNNHPWLAIYEYSGLSTTSPLDQTAAAQGSGSSPACGPTAATTAANELVFAGVGLVSNSTATVTAGAGYTLAQQDTNTSRAANETAMLSSTGTQTARFTLSGTTNYSCVLATFKP
jgi:subtilisin family serine protease